MLTQNFISRLDQLELDDNDRLAMMARLAIKISDRMWLQWRLFNAQVKIPATEGKEWREEISYLGDLL